jgi:hypothetical protein
MRARNWLFCFLFALGILWFKAGHRLDSKVSLPNPSSSQPQPPQASAAISAPESISEPAGPKPPQAATPDKPVLAGEQALKDRLAVFASLD